MKITDLKKRIESWSKTRIALMTLLMFVITFFMLVLAGWQTYELAEQTDKLVEVNKKLSTRFAGEFPNNIDQIIELINEAEEEIIIITDVSGYAIFSSPEKFEEYTKAIIKKIQTNVSVEILTYNEKVMLQQSIKQFCRLNEMQFSEQELQIIYDYGALEEQYANNTDLAKKLDSAFIKSFGSKKDMEKAVKEFRDYKFTVFGGELKSIRDSQLKDNNPNFITFKRALNSMHCYIDYHFKHFFDVNPSCKFSYKKTNEPHNIFAWIVDHKKSVFSFLNFYKNKETSFFSRDDKFIEHIHQSAMDRFESIKQSEQESSNANCLNDTLASEKQIVD